MYADLFIYSNIFCNVLTFDCVSFSLHVKSMSILSLFYVVTMLVISSTFVMFPECPWY